MRTTLLVLGLFGCDDEQARPATPASPPARPPSEPPARADAPTPTPSPAASGATSGAADLPRVDCAALVTDADVTAACGTSVDVGPASRDLLPKTTVCGSTLRRPGERFPIGRVSVNAFPDRAATESWVKLEQPDEGTPIAGLGDRAWSKVTERAKLKVTNYDVLVVSGRMVLKLGTEDGLAKSPCTIEQLTALAKIVAGRLPTS